MKKRTEKKGLMMDKVETNFLPVKDVLEEAKKYVDLYREAESFVPGDLVVWKEGMKNKLLPDYGEPIVVLEIFPLVRGDADGSVYGCEPLNMRCLVLKNHDNGTFMEFAYDSNRFTMYNLKTTNTRR